MAHCPTASSPRRFTVSQSPAHLRGCRPPYPQLEFVFAAGAIPDEDIAAIIGYLKGLEQEPSVGFTLGGPGPVTEGLFG